MSFIPDMSLVLPKKSNNATNRSSRSQGCTNEKLPGEEYYLQPLNTSVDSDTTRKKAEQAFIALSATGGYCAIPNLIPDLLRGILKRNEYDVLFYILRRTLGFHKIADAISISQFQFGIVTRLGKRLDYGCGIKSAETIHRALRALEERGFIVRQTTKTATGASGANIYQICPEVVLQAALAQTEASFEETTPADTQTGLEPHSGIIAQLDAAYVEEMQTRAGQTAGEGVSKRVSECVPPPYPVSFDPSRSVLQIDKTKSQKTDSKNSSSWAGATSTDLQPEKLVMSSQMQKADLELLMDFGFDRSNAFRLLSIAATLNKGRGYIAGIIAYARQKASSNPQGMARVLIEQGEERKFLRRNASVNRKPVGWESFCRPVSFPAEDRPDFSPAYSQSTIATATPATLEKGNDETRSQSFQPTVLIAVPAAAGLQPDEIGRSKAIERYLSCPLDLVKALESGQENPDDVRLILTRLGVFRRYESDFWRACQQYRRLQKCPA